MLIGATPIGAFASEVQSLGSGAKSGTDTGGASKPKVSVTSLYSYQGQTNDSLGYRALPDDAGSFYFNIKLDKQPANGEDVVVYYRTIDDTAVAKWGDYESVGVNGDAYVTLTKSSGYSATVVVKSVLLEHSYKGPTTASEIGSDAEQMIFSRRFMFELIDAVGGNAEIDKSVDSAGNKRNRLNCYLRADKYNYFTESNAPATETFIEHINLINTPNLNGPYTSYMSRLNITFDESVRNYVASGDYSLAFAMFGDCYEYYWQSDGIVNFTLYYRHDGKTKKAFTMYMEGEWDDSTFYGWERIFEYYEYWLKNGEAPGGSLNDYASDNFVGFTLYDNDEKVVVDIKRDHDAEDVLPQLQKLLYTNMVTEEKGPTVNNTDYDIDLMHYLRLPSNFVFADYYAYLVESKTKDGEYRWLEDVSLLFRLVGTEKPKVIENEVGSQYINTNIEQLFDGDKIKMQIRYDRPVYVANNFVPLNSGCHIEALINGEYLITLYPANKYVSDTMVFEGDLPEALKDKKITSIKNIELKDSANSKILSHLTNLPIFSYEFDDIYNLNGDLRTPYSIVSVDSTESWTKARPLDVYSYVQETGERFNDFVTVYYEWNNDNTKPPETYSNRITLNTKNDGEVMKTIIGTGNGTSYLHIKTVSRYGRWTYSDKLTKTYDPDGEGTYTPFGPFSFDNEAPEFPSGNVDDFISAGGTQKEFDLTIAVPHESDGSGINTMSLYYIPKNSEDGQGVLLKTFKDNVDFTKNTSTVNYKISHLNVGVGVNGEFVRETVEFYWILSDKIENTSERTGKFTLTFDTNDYLNEEIESVGPFNVSGSTGSAMFESTTQKLDDLTYIYDYSLNEGKEFEPYMSSGNPVYYAFAFTIKNGAFTDPDDLQDVDDGVYGVNVYCKGEQLDEGSYTLIEDGEGTGVYVVLILAEVESSRYDIQLTRTENGSTRVSQNYTIYATNNENDDTAVKEKIESGTLINNKVYQLSSDYQFYYKNENGDTIVKEPYNNTKAPATFSGISKAKEYVYYMELSDIYLFYVDQVVVAELINSNAPGYVKATGEEQLAEVGQYWIRYKSKSWTPDSTGDSWVLYYYGRSGALAQNALSQNLFDALNSVSNRIVGYGKSLVLTDTSLLLGSAMGDKMLDKNGMPYLLDGQIHNKDESSSYTKCGNKWSVPAYYSADREIYKSVININDTEYPIAGSLTVPEGTRLMYMTNADYLKLTDNNVTQKPDWKNVNIDISKGESFINFFTTSGIYYIREFGAEGISIYPIYIDKDAPEISYRQQNSANGELEQTVFDGSITLTISAIQAIFNGITDKEFDRNSYLAIYTNSLSLVGVYTADELVANPVSLKNGNYQVVVADRSGNHYTVSVKVNDVLLKCEIKEYADSSIKLTCNRSQNEISRYEVYLNGELVTATYAQEKTFKDAGHYTIYIQDIYGGVYTEQYDFERSAPTVSWRYLGEDGKYHNYDPNSTGADGFAMSMVSNNRYSISTSAEIRFYYSSGYKYEFIGTAPEYEQSMVSDYVTIAAGQSFTLKVYYSDYPDNYVIYSGLVDVTPPEISVKADLNIYGNGEYTLVELVDEYIIRATAGEQDLDDLVQSIKNELSYCNEALVDEWLENLADGDTSNDDATLLAVKDLYYIVTDKNRRNVDKGDTVISDAIRVDVSDANGLYLVEVYLNGRIVQTQDISSGFSQIVLTRQGEYRIVAKDGLGNVSEFNFTNGLPDNLDYYVDGAEKVVDNHAYLNFEVINGMNVYKNVDFGNREFKIDLKRDATVFISVGLSGEESEVYGFSVVDGCVYPVTYEIANGKVELVTGLAIIDVNDLNFKFKTEYIINGEDSAHAIYASVKEDKTLTFKVNAPEDNTKAVLVEARVNFGNDDIAFVSAELSKKVSGIILRDDENEVISGSQSSFDIRTNKDFTVDESVFESERVSAVSLYYSNLNDLKEDALENKKNVYVKDAVYDKEGFYLLVVKNRYGNEAIYRISISKSFGITASVTFGDGNQVYYSKNYNKTLYSNYEAVLDILDEGVEYTVQKDGSAYSEYVTKKEDSGTYLVFSAQGTYEVSFTDSYGMTAKKRIEINKSSYTVSEDLLTGYNEKALRKDEGYTNQKLSVDKGIYDSEGLYYLAVKYNDTLNVVFDDFSETPVTTDTAELNGLIGSMGDGVYTVICRNRYGAVVTKDIHYRGTPTLNLERTTRSTSKAEAYDLNYAISLGFWSNNSLIFKTDATSYVFKIDGNVTECPRTLSFDGAGEFGRSEYDITYIDEYGFEYSFKAYLVRRTVNINVPSSITGVDVNGVLNTKNDISVTFDDDMYAVYTRNNGEEVRYNSGDVIKKDGTYRFTVMDYAGNTSTLTIKKDTVVEASFIESSTMTSVLNGSVVNSPKVSLDVLNSDSAYIEKVLRNGVLQTDFSGTKFTEDGKWEIILSDKLGNKSYFSFYLITHSVNGFEYTTPYEYIITEVWYDSGDGVKITYMNFVNHDEYSSSFTFVENGHYSVVMTSKSTGNISKFNFTVNTSAPNVSLVGCNEGETTVNDVTVAGCKIGDRIKVYRTTRSGGEELVSEVVITTSATRVPVINEGGKYRIVVESEAGVPTELTFVRKHVMNTAGSVFIMVIIGISVAGLFTGLIYRNKSKTDE